MIKEKETILKERDGKFFLFNPSEFNRKENQIRELEKVYREAGDLLREYDYPTREEWQFAILEEGSDALERLVSEDAKENAVRLRVQRYLKETFVEIALSKIPEELKEKVQALPGRLQRAKDGLPLLKKDLSFRERTIFLDTESLKARLLDSMTIAVPPSAIEDARKLRDVVLAVRELEERGIYARELVNRFTGEYLAPDYYPNLEEKKLVFSVFVRRHPTRAETLLTSPEYVKKVEIATKELIERGLYGITAPQTPKQ